MTAIMTTIRKQHHNMPPPSAAAIQHSQKLIAHLSQLITQQHGWIGFDQYMQAALYAPGLGYYQSGNHKIGAAGDFVTAPEITPLFGQCLAEQIAPILSALDQPIIFELGAGSGKMAADILLQLQRQHTLPDAYWILEPSADLQARQKAYLTEQLPDFVTQIHWLRHLPDQDFNGLIIGNEVIDALPVKRFEVSQGEAYELGVNFDGDRFQWQRGQPLTLPVALPHSTQWPEQFTSEINTQLPDWLASISSHLQQGVMLFLDYGYAAREYYHPERCHGTLGCYYRHCKHDDPFVYPGLQDITASVDFTALAQAAIDCDLTVAGYTTQALFLAVNKIDQLTQDGLAAHPDSNTQTLAKIRQLMLPEAMGESVKVMALTKRWDAGCFDDWVDRCHQL